MAWLGTRLRRRRRHHADPRRVALTVAERRRPKRLAASRRLAPRVRYTPPAPQAHRGLSDFAARWMFGDGVAEGDPWIAGAGADYDRPSFLTEPDEPPPAPARSGLRGPAVGRPGVEELGPRFRLTHTPPEPAQAESEPVAPPPPAPGPAPRRPAPAAPAAEPEYHHEPEPETIQAAPQEPRPVVRRAEGEAEPQRQVVHVHHHHEGEGEEEGRRESRASTAIKAGRVGVRAEQIERGRDRWSELGALGKRAIDATRGEWSKWKREGEKWRDRAEHDVHRWQREGRGVLAEARRVERDPSRLGHDLRQLEHQPLVRSAVNLIRRQPLFRQTAGLIHQVGRDLGKVGQFEKRVAGAERQVAKALRDPEKELETIGKRLEKDVMNRPLVRRAEAALKDAERTAERDAKALHVPQVPGLAAAKAAALAAAAEVPLEVSRAGRAVVQFESAARGAAHRLESEARHAVAEADGHVPHSLGHVPHLPAVPSVPGVADAGREAERLAHAPQALEQAAADHMYTQVVDRLRRDLLAERERMGNLLGDWP